MLILRAVVGFTLLIQAAAYLIEWRSLRLDAWVAAALAVSAGIGLLAGILTPITSVLVVLIMTGYALSLIPPPRANLFDSNLANLRLIAIAVAILFLGPGAFSLDARLFGRREIFIPQNPRSRNPDAPCQ